MKVSAYHIEANYIPIRENPPAEFLFYQIPGDWFPFVPRVSDCFWPKGLTGRLNPWLMSLEKEATKTSTSS